MERGGGLDLSRAADFLVTPLIRVRAPGARPAVRRVAAWPPRRQTTASDEAKRSSRRVSAARKASCVREIRLSHPQLCLVPRALDRADARDPPRRGPASRRRPVPVLASPDRPTDSNAVARIGF